MKKISFSHSSAQESETSSSYNEWSATALRKMKEASPLSLKVTLQSVSYLPPYISIHLTQLSFHFSFLWLALLATFKIREGRFQPLDQCLAREYRMSLVWITQRVSNDFCEVWSSQVIIPMRVQHWELIVIHMQGIRARLVDRDFAPKVDNSLIFQLA